MFERVRQVGMTYVTGPYVWWGAAFVSLMVVPQLLLAMNVRRGATASIQPTVIFLAMPLLFVLPFLVGQVKTQFAHARARLMPRFGPAHLVVLIGILLVLIGIYPIAIARMLGVPILGIVSFIVAIAAPAIWGAHFNRFGPMLVSLIVFYSAMTAWGQNFWIANSSVNQAAHVGIVVVAAAVIVSWLWRLCRLTEEMDDYQNVYLMLMARRTGSEAIEQRRVVASQIGRNRFVGWVSDTWHRRLGGYFGGSKAGLARLLRYGFAAHPIELQGFFMAAVFIALGVFMSRFSFLSNGSGGAGGLWFFMMFAILLPGMTAGELMAQRRPRIANELLLPLSRRQLIDGLFSAAARNSAVLWTMMNAALAFVVGMVADVIEVSAVLAFLLVSAAAAFASMGISLRVSIWPSRVKRYLVLWATWIVIIVPLMVWMVQREHVGDWPVVPAAVLFAGIGAWLYQAGRHAWIELELA